jgi:hypothetical protein
MSIDPQLRTWQNSLSAQQLGSHIDKPATEFSTAFSDPKYQKNGGGFKKLYRGLSSDRPFPDEVTKKSSEFETLGKPVVGRHWTDDLDSARKFATGIASNELDGYIGAEESKHGRTLTGLVHTTDIWDHDEPGSLQAHKEADAYHPENDDTHYLEGENERLLKKNAPVYVKEAWDIKRDKNAPYLQDPEEMDDPSDEDHDAWEERYNDDRHWDNYDTTKQRTINKVFKA